MELMLWVMVWLWVCPDYFSPTFRTGVFVPGVYVAIAIVGPNAGLNALHFTGAWDANHHGVALMALAISIHARR